MTKRLELMGHKFEKLTVIGDSGANRFGQSMWECACECGGITVTSGINLRNNHSRSCGCEQSKPAHGHTANDTRSSTYKSWASMVNRCSRADQYRLLGITVAPEWIGRGGFELFLAEIGERPTDAHTVDRIDGTRGYEPGNVRWATSGEQARNVKSNVWIVVGGKRMIARDAATEYGINYKTLLHRLKKMDPDTAVTMPVRHRGVA